MMLHVAFTVIRHGGKCIDFESFYCLDLRWEITGIYLKKKYFSEKRSVQLTGNEDHHLYIVFVNDC